MANRGILKQAVVGLALVALLCAMNSADAQRRRLPSRTEPIPETETAAERAAKEKEEREAKEAPNPSMMIYGPAVPPLGAPPAPPIPESVLKPEPAKPVAVPAPAPAPTLAPAPVVAPVVAPLAPPSAPLAVPIPAAPPPPPVAAPAPPPAPPAAPVAAPAPVIAPPPPPIAAPAPVVAPLPAPVAAPAPVVAPPPPAPVAAPMPVIAPPPPPVAKPAAAPERREVAAVAPPASPFPAPKLDAKLVEQIFSCLSPGLPQDWKRTWVVVASPEAAAATKFFVTSSYRDEDAEEYVPCNVQEITRRITSLSDALPPEQRRWKSARLAIDSEGEYELKYDYAR